MCVSEGVGVGGKRLGASARRLRRSSCSSQPARRMCLEMPRPRFESGQNSQIYNLHIVTCEYRYKEFTQLGAEV